MNLPRIFVSLARIFKENGYSLYMVGGTTRDYLLNKKILDFDFVTDATVDEMTSFLNISDAYRSIGSTTISFEGEKVDITTLRKEGEYLDYRHPSNVEFVKSIKEDFIRRDFTINAIYVNDEGDIIDYSHGMLDLKNRIIRMIGDPYIRLKEDSLRILRAIRFAVSLSFDLDEELKNAILKEKYMLRKINYFKCLTEIVKTKKIDQDYADKMLKSLGIDEVIPLSYNLSRTRLDVIDMHCDTITALPHYKEKLFKNNRHIDIIKLCKGDYLLQCFAIFIRLAKVENPYEEFLHYYDIYKKEMEENSFIISQVTSYKELMENKSKRIISSLLTVEEGDIIQGDLSKLDDLYNKGVRMISLTWNYNNSLANSNFVYNDEGVDLYTPNTNGGLTPLGIKWVKRMNELGMIIDVSHLSDAGFYDVIKYSTQPIVASHSNSRAIQPVVRNLTDDMILALSKNGGVMGINYCPMFISDSEEDQIKDIVEHIKHIVDVGGINVVALGSDFDGISTPKGMENASMTHKLKEALENAGFSRKDINKIFHENFLRVFKKVCSK